MPVAEAIKPQPEAAHVELRLGETFDGGRIGRMADNRVGQRSGDAGAHAVEQRDLRPGIGILFGHVGTVEVREDRSDLDLRGFRQRLAQRPDFVVHEAQPVHTRVELDMDRVTALARMHHGPGEGSERMKAVYLGFEAVGDHLIETVGIGVEHHDGHRNAPLPQQYPLVGERHGQVIDALVLQELRDFEIAGTVRTGLDHRHELRTEAELRTEEIKVVRHSVEVDLQHCRMAAAREGVRQFLETEIAGAFQQDGTPGHRPAVDARDALVGRGVKLLVAAEQTGMAFQARADADQEVDAGTCDHPRDTAVEFVVGKPALRDIRQDERTAAVQRHAVQVIECQRQRIEVEVIGVVDQDRIVDALLHLEAHGQRRRRSERRIWALRRDAALPMTDSGTSGNAAASKGLRSAKRAATMPPSGS